MAAKLHCLCALSILAILGAAAGAAHAGVTDKHLCGFSFPAPIRDAWTAVGGSEGRLGCPASAVTTADTSRQQTRGRQVLFTDGIIVWHQSGSRANDAYVVWGCLFRLYFQFGATSGWLGMPTSDPINTPDGQKQAFEGGEMRYIRATDSCSAEPTPRP